VNSAKNEEDARAVLAMCSKAILEAEKNKDVETWRAVGQLIDRVSPPAKDFKPAFSGTLLSEGAFTTFSSVSSRWDKHPWMHWNLGGKRPGMFHTNEDQNPWVTLELRHFGELTGIEIVNRKTHRERAVPLHVSVSVDGKTWKEIAVFNKPRASWKIDLSGKHIRARFIRLMKKGKGFLHLDNARAYGRRVS
jgi:hypothetical protein